MQTPINLTVNGREQRLEVDTRATLVTTLREGLGLTGAHVGCSTGNCGACTVLLDDQTVKSCCILTADVDGSRVTTIEALSSGPDDLHPVQRAFVENQGLQCGYCTPGMVLSAVQLLKTNPEPDEEQIRHGIAGNLCRCTGYQLIVKSISEAGKALSTNSRAPA